jgi:hypothetical protein
VAEHDAGGQRQKHQEPQLEMERAGRSAARLRDGIGWSVIREERARRRPALTRNPPGIRPPRREQAFTATT